MPPPKQNIICRQCGKEARTVNAYFCSMTCRNLSKQWREGIGTALRGKSYPKKCAALDQNRKLRKFGPEWRKNVGESIAGQKNGGYTTGICAYRRLAFKYKHKQCEICYHSDKRLLVHHSDGNRHHNVIENLQVLCYGCHGKQHGDAISRALKGRLMTWGDKVSATKLAQGKWRSQDNPKWKGGITFRN